MDGGRRVSGGGAVEADGGALARRDAAVARHRVNPRGDCKKGEGGKRGLSCLQPTHIFSCSEVLGLLDLVAGCQAGWLTGWEWDWEEASSPRKNRPHLGL